MFFVFCNTSGQDSLWWREEYLFSSDFWSCIMLEQWNILLLFKIMALAPVLNYWGPVMSWTTSSLLIWTKLLLELTHSLKTQKKRSRLGIKRLKTRFSSEDDRGWYGTPRFLDEVQQVSVKTSLFPASWIWWSPSDYLYLPTARISNKTDIVVKLLHAEVKG